MIRKVTPKDAKAITDIYNYYVRTSVATLEENEVSEKYFTDQINEVTQKFPWFVYEVNNEIIGFANASAWKTRSGYKKSVQLTIYLSPNTTSKGIGSLLYESVINELQKLDVHILMGGISLPNDASVRLHEKFGFVKSAHFKEIGYKFNNWVDVGYWQLVLKK
ncbi:N-acetyltransferase family protein [Tenacibaculum sp. IB213877]|uniref:GNAT family N-acetyltransferase n=1 Tax=Tenacibaculum sp. IB213877 TaxID=3097351 RepID=UPI002A5988A2|nr:N-acetyltransferase family protein [Tenacibaculum sp. IB213877]MDY0780353.1 GNAT family N-acetyltransferase [Tenacibaculum sp. IB213877]